MDIENSENIQPEENNNQTVPQKLEVNDQIIEQLISAGKWAKFLAILGFVFIGFMVLMGFMISVIMSFMPSGPFRHMPIPGFLFGFVYLVIGIVYFFPILYLLRFSTNIQQAISTNNTLKMLKAFENLKSHYRYIGIVMIVMLGLYLLTFVFMVFAGMLAGFSGFTGMQA
ncbi:DUF5362 family protein [Maribellus mangrovi]|uniref:DUF5362 family protein n=1 Tax=Maribellus mangrovi TaxID=3133146 RepID=UPI0030ED7FBF